MLTGNGLAVCFCSRFRSTDLSNYPCWRNPEISGYNLCLAPKGNKSRLTTDCKTLKLSSTILFFNSIAPIIRGRTYYKPARAGGASRGGGWAIAQSPSDASELVTTITLDRLKKRGYVSLLELYNLLKPNTALFPMT